MKSLQLLPLLLASSMASNATTSIMQNGVFTVPRLDSLKVSASALQKADESELRSSCQDWFNFYTSPDLPLNQIPQGFSTQFASIRSQPLVSQTTAPGIGISPEFALKLNVDPAKEQSAISAEVASGNLKLTNGNVQTLPGLNVPAQSFLVNITRFDSAEIVPTPGMQSLAAVAAYFGLPKATLQTTDQGVVILSRDAACDLILGNATLLVHSKAKTALNPTELSKSQNLYSFVATEVTKISAAHNSVLTRAALVGFHLGDDLEKAKLATSVDEEDQMIQIIFAQLLDPVNVTLNQFWDMETFTLKPPANPANDTVITITGESL